MLEPRGGVSTPTHNLHSFQHAYLPLTHSPVCTCSLHQCIRIGSSHWAPPKHLNITLHISQFMYRLFYCHNMTPGYFLGSQHMRWQDTLSDSEEKETLLKMWIRFPNGFCACFDCTNSFFRLNWSRWLEPSWCVHFFGITQNPLNVWPFSSVIDYVFV